VAWEAGSYSPDGERFAYVPNLKWQEAWKRLSRRTDYPGISGGFEKFAVGESAAGKFQ